MNTLILHVKYGMLCIQEKVLVRVTSGLIDVLTISNHVRKYVKSEMVRSRLRFDKLG